MPDPIARLEFCRDEVNRVFGEDYAAAHPEVVSAVMIGASLDYAAQLIASALVIDEDLAAPAPATRNGFKLWRGNAQFRSMRAHARAKSRASREMFSVSQLRRETHSHDMSR